MRIFKYWIIKTATLKIGEFEQESKMYGGSNLSEQDAEKDATNRLDRAQKFINGELQRDDTYETNIIEEIIDKIDDNNVITRNRYGALVLNSKNQMFIDVDNLDRGLFDKLFNKNKSPKQINLARIQKTIQKKRYSELGFIIYETFKGYRIAVTGDNFNPRDKQSNRIMSDFRSDYLYRLLCYRQNCYRARLTPKPYRIGQRRLKMIFPNRTEKEQLVHDNWVKEYKEKSYNFVTCKKVEQYGRIYRNRILDYHDEMCGIRYNYQLA